MLAAELIAQFTTIEYELPSAPALGPPVFLLVVDTCVDEEEMDELKDALQQTLLLIPEDSLVNIAIIRLDTHTTHKLLCSLIHILGWLDHLWYSRDGPRAGIHRVPAIVRIPWQQGLHPAGQSFSFHALYIHDG